MTKKYILKYVYDGYDRHNKTTISTTSRADVINEANHIVYLLDKEFGIDNCMLNLTNDEEFMNGTADNYLAQIIIPREKEDGQLAYDSATIHIEEVSNEQ